MAKKRSSKKKSPVGKKSPAGKKRSRGGRAAEVEPEVRLLEEIAATAEPGAGDPFDRRFRIEPAEACKLEFFREWYGFTEDAAADDRGWRRLD